MSESTRRRLVALALVAGILALAGCGGGGDKIEQPLVAAEERTANVDQLLSDGAAWLRGGITSQELQPTVAEAKDDLARIDEGELEGIAPGTVELQEQPIDFTEPEATDADLTATEAAALSLLQVKRFCGAAVDRLEAALEQGDGPPEEAAAEIAGLLEACSRARQIEGVAFERLSGE